MRKPSQFERCCVCGREKSRAHVGYDIKTLKAYCLNPMHCSVEHPNSPKSQREGVPYIHLVPAKKSQLAIELNKFYDEYHAHQIYNMLGKSKGFRPNPREAMYMLKLMQVKGFETYNDVIRYAMEFLMQHLNLDEVIYGDDSTNKKARWVDAEVEDDEYAEYTFDDEGEEEQVEESTQVEEETEDEEDDWEIEI